MPVASGGPASVPLANTFSPDGSSPSFGGASAGAGSFSRRQVPHSACSPCPSMGTAISVGTSTFRIAAKTFWSENAMSPRCGIASRPVSVRAQGGRSQSRRPAQTNP
jgi:hypothetical protein